MQNLTATIPAPAPVNAPNTPKISVKIPTFREVPKKNVILWMLQVQNLFKVQGIDNELTQIYYATTGFEGAAFYWYLNRVAATGNQVAFAN